MPNNFNNDNFFNLQYEIPKLFHFEENPYSYFKAT